MKVVVPDLGHGNSIGIFGDGVSPLLVDCGTKDYSKTTNFTNLLELPLRKIGSKDLVITHYHTDHYNLLDNFHNSFFENIHLPALPRQSSAAQLMREFIALAMVAGYGEYYLTQLIKVKGKNFCCHVKGEFFNALNRDWEVLWPDYSIIDKRNERKIMGIMRKIQDSKRELNERQASKFDYWYSRLSREFGGEQQKSENHDEFGEKEDPDPVLMQKLGAVETAFKEIANRASLVVKDDQSEFLFTGDIDGTILDNYLNFGINKYLFIEAPHHGGYYGSAFDNVSTEALILSRRERDKPDSRFLRDLQWRFLVDTAKTGNCVIHQTGQLSKNIIAYVSIGVNFVAFFI